MVDVAAALNRSDKEPVARGDRSRDSVEVVELRSAGEARSDVKRAEKTLNEINELCSPWVQGRELRRAALYRTSDAILNMGRWLLGEGTRQHVGLIYLRGAKPGDEMENGTCSAEKHAREGAAFFSA
jgi:hypothetical protein